MAGSELILETLLTLCLLLFAAKVGGEIARKLGLAAIVGELLAGVIMAPTLIGGFHLFGMQLITLNDGVSTFAELGAVLLLFLVGLETRFADFKRSGLISTCVATGGVIVPFVLGFGLVSLWGYSWQEALLVAAALTATSIAITVKTLKDINRFHSRESNVLISAAVIDDVLGLIVLAIVLGLVNGGGLDIAGIGMTAVKSIAIWLALTLLGVFVLAKVINFLCPCLECEPPRDIHGNPLPMPHHHCAIKCHGTQEASAVAMCFGFAFLAGVAGLAPILGAFAAGMSIAETRVLHTIHEVTEKIDFIMAPLFFVVIGALVDLTGLTLNALLFAGTLIVLAMAGKIIGCGLPVYFFTRDWKESVVVGVGMMSRGEVGLIIAGIGATSGLFTRDVFSAVVLMVIVTTIVTPIALREAYERLKLDINPMHENIVKRDTDAA